MSGHTHTCRRLRTRSSLLLAATAIVLLTGTLAAGTAMAGVMHTESRYNPTRTAMPAVDAGMRARSLVFGSMASAGPVAEADGLNPVVKPFSFFLIYHSVNSLEIALKAFEIKPFFPQQAAPLGGCLHCLGFGHFQSYVVKRDTLTEKVRGTRLLTTHTRFSQAIVRRGEIGRFKVYGVALNPARPFVRQAGCLGADTGVTNDDLIYGRALPLVGCTAATPRDGATSFNAPAELSKTVQGHGSVSGNAKGERWLSVFKVHAACGANAQATKRIHGVSGAVWKVRGRFRETFTTGLDTRAGHFCVYLQDGGRWHKVPDGRISQRGSIAFFGGDSVSITGAATGAAGQAVADTFGGFASASEVLWTFDSYTPCAPTAEAEYPAAVGVGVNSVKGLFSLSVNSIPLAQSAYRCGYLQVGASSHHKPTGPTLASASALITVS
ncbi:MAG: hypothetical protein ACR2NR_17620 [Solirubrobacteraceae bacterium]